MGDEIKTAAAAAEATVKSKAVAFFAAHKAAVIAFVVGLIVGIAI